LSDENEDKGPCCAGATARLALHVYSFADVLVHAIVLAAFWVQRGGAFWGVIVCEVWLVRLLGFAAFELVLVEREEWTTEFLLTNVGLGIFFGGPQVVLDIPLTDTAGSTPLKLQLLVSFVEHLAFSCVSCLSGTRPLPKSLGCSCYSGNYDIRRNNITCIPHMRTIGSGLGKTELGDVGDAPAHTSLLIVIVLLLWLVKVVCFCQLNAMARKGEIESQRMFPSGRGGSGSAGSMGGSSGGIGFHQQHQQQQAYDAPLPRSRGFSRGSSRSRSRGRGTPGAGDSSSSSSSSGAGGVGAATPPASTWFKAASSSSSSDSAKVYAESEDELEDM